ncbi:MAG: alpha-galactosidase [Lentisphaeria bacterium]|nr:alpha-galactosidase [Lentisphaeria bacterium]
MDGIIQKMLAPLNCGDLLLTPYAVVEGKTETGTVTSCVSHPDRGNIRMGMEKQGVFSDTLSFRFDGDQIRCRREFRNLSGKIMKLNELGAALEGIDFGKVPRDDFFYHIENHRVYETMAFPVDYNRTAKDAKDSSFDFQAGNRWADPGVVCERIGRSPYQPFPAILLGNYHSKHGLVHGTLSQRVFYHNYLVKHDNSGKVRMDIFSSFKDTSYIEVKPGQILVDEWYLGATERADEIEHIFDNYTAVLRQVLPPMYGATDINRTSMVWGTWNDGIFRDISESMIVEEAEFLKKNFPTVRWIQVDDGYAKRVPPAHGLGCVYEGEDGIDHSKFPGGLRSVTDKIREIGLRPAIWIGGFCPVQTPIYQEHPEWFIDYTYRVKCSQPLDVSLPEVREYMTHAIDVLCTEYGFEAVKHDFWSYAFEDSNAQYHRHDASGYQWREWWLKEIRKRIARDGYFQTGCDIVMGNPFLGEFFTNYRYGIDIGSGNWDHVKTNYLWGVACFATHTSDLFVPNSDSVGLFPGLQETEAMFCLNYCLVTHSMVEIAGRLSQHADSPRIPILKKAVCNPNNGQEIFLGPWNYLDRKQKYPEIIYFKTAHFCPKEDQPGLPLRTAGLFNLEDEAKKVSFIPEDLGLNAGTYRVTDVWSGDSFTMTDRLVFDLPPHGSRLLAVSKADPQQLLDANIRVLRTEKQGNTLKLYFDYAADADFTFASRPVRISLDGKSIPADGNSVRAAIGEKSVMEIDFA